MTFRRRIIVAMVPLFALLVALGGTGTILIYHLGNRIDEILRENYDSVIYMRDLNEALERIDSSFQFRAGRAGKGLLPAVRGKLETVRRRPIQGATQHHLARGRRTGRQPDGTEQPLSASRRRVLQTDGPKTGQALLWRAELARALRQIPRDQSRFGRDSADQPGQHGGGKPAGASDGPFLPDLVWRRLGDRYCLGRIPHRRHDSHDPVPDSCRHRIGRGHRRGRPGSTGPRLVGG